MKAISHAPSRRCVCAKAPSRRTRASMSVDGRAAHRCHAFPQLAKWAEARDIDAVIWTALEPTFDSPHATDIADRVVQYVGTLQAAARDDSECYVRFAPRQ